MSDTNLTIKMVGPEVDNGEIRLSRLLNFGETFQKLLREIAVAYSKEEDAAYHSPSRLDTALRVTSIDKGSFTLGLTLHNQTPSIDLVSNVDVGTIALNKLFDGVIALQETSELPSGYSQPVLRLWQELGKSLLQKGVDMVFFNLDVAGRREKSVIYTQETHTRIVKLLDPPKGKKQVLRGYFWLVNFQKDRRNVRLHLENGKSVKCTFDEEMAQTVQEAMQHFVRVWGVAHIKVDKIQRLEIKGVTILDQDPPTPPQPKYQTFEEAKDYIFEKNFELHRELA